MVLKYGVTKHDYKTKQTKVLEWYNSKHNALSELEKLAYSYIYDKEGVQDIKIYGRYDHGKPYTHYLYRDPTKYLDKLIIKRKIKITGILYNETKYENIIAYYLTEYEDGTTIAVDLFYKAGNNRRDQPFIDLLNEIRQYKKCNNNI